MEEQVIKKFRVFDRSYRNIENKEEMLYLVYEVYLLKSNTGSF